MQALSLCSLRGASDPCQSPVQPDGVIPSSNGDILLAAGLCSTALRCSYKSIFESDIAEKRCNLPRLLKRGNGEVHRFARSFSKADSAQQRASEKTCSKVRPPIHGCSVFSFRSFLLSATFLCVRSAFFCRVCVSVCVGGPFVPRRGFEFLTDPHPYPCGVTQAAVWAVWGGTGARGVASCFLKTAAAAACSVDPTHFLCLSFQVSFFEASER